MQEFKVVHCTTDFEVHVAGNIENFEAYRAPAKNFYFERSGRDPCAHEFRTDL